MYTGLRVISIQSPSGNPKKLRVSAAALTSLVAWRSIHSHVEHTFPSLSAVRPRPFNAQLRLTKRLRPIPPPFVMPFPLSTFDTKLRGFLVLNPRNLFVKYETHMYSLFGGQRGGVRSRGRRQSQQIKVLTCVGVKVGPRSPEEVPILPFRILFPHVLCASIFTHQVFCEFTSLVRATVF